MRFAGRGPGTVFWLPVFEIFPHTYFIFEMQALDVRGFGSLFDPPNSALPYPPAPLDPSFSYFSSWSWAFSMGIPCPFPSHTRIQLSYGQPRFYTDNMWSFLPSDHFIPIAYLFLSEPADPDWARRLCPLLGEI